MDSSPPISIRDALKSALITAMKQRDKTAVATFRAAIAAIDNAEAVPLDDDNRAGAIESSRVGVGAAETERRVLTEVDMTRIVRAEIAEARSAADLLDGRDDDGAATLRDGARILDDLLAVHAPS